MEVYNGLIQANADIVKRMDKICRYLIRVVKNKTFQSGDIPPKTNKRSFIWLKAISCHMVETLRNMSCSKIGLHIPEMLRNEDGTVVIQRSIWSSKDENNIRKHKKEIINLIGRHGN